MLYFLSFRKAVAWLDMLVLNLFKRLEKYGREEEMQRAAVKTTLCIQTCSINLLRRQFYHLYTEAERKWGIVPVASTPDLLPNTVI